MVAPALAGLWAFASPAPAHMVFGSRTLWQLVQDADLVVHARVESAGSWLGLEGPPVARPRVEARVLDVIRGEAPEGALRFAQHGHGTADFAPGDEVVVFLRRAERVRELDELARDGALAFVSLQEHDEKWSLDARTREPVLAAARAYAAAALLPPPQRKDALRVVTLPLLGSPDARLAGSALRDMMSLPSVDLVRRQDVPALEPLLARESIPIGIRVGLLGELERRGLLEGAPRWVALLRATSGEERVTVIYAAGAHPSPPVGAELAELLAGPDAAEAEAAAIALGNPGEADAVGPLAKALERSEPRVRMAAIRGLGMSGTPQARAVLEAAAESHPDPATRRRAKAEAALLARGATRQSP